MSFKKLSLVALFCFKAATCFAFDSAEHIWIGDSIALPYPGGEMPRFPDKKSRRPRWISRNAQVRYEGPIYPYEKETAELAANASTLGIDLPALTPYYLAIGEVDGQATYLSFGEIVALAGDYIGNPEPTLGLPKNILSSYGISTISDQSVGKNINRFDQSAQFLIESIWSIRSFDYEIEPLNKSPFFKSDNLTNMRSLFKQEFKDFSALLSQTSIEGLHKESARAHGGLFSKAKANVNPFSGSGKSPFYQALLAKNTDHFGEDAKRSYLAGHIAAIREATTAFNKRDNPSAFKYHLNRAYIFEAFACHFLSDLFSAGHIRTPRRPLLEVPGISAVNAGFLANAMHDEDGFLGLDVRDSLGNHWKAYGDHSYFDYKSHSNRMRARDALQNSVFEIWHVATGDLVYQKELTDLLTLNSDVFSTALLRVPEFIEDRQGGMTFFPMIKVDDDGRVHVRTNMDNPYKDGYYNIADTTLRGLKAQYYHSRDAIPPSNFFEFVNSKAGESSKRTVDVNCSPWSLFGFSFASFRTDVEVNAYKVSRSDENVAELLKEINRPEVPAIQGGIYYIVDTQNAEKILNTCSSSLVSKTFDPVGTPFYGKGVNGVFDPYRPGTVLVFDEFGKVSYIDDWEIRRVELLLEQESGFLRSWLHRVSESWSIDHSSNSQSD